MIDLTSRWSEIDAIFQAALDLADDERAAFLDERCGGDDELRAAVDRLLQSSGDTEQMLESGGAWTGAFAQEAISDLIDLNQSGRRIGPWRVVRTIGFGGMAEIYFAERADGQFEQEVALKVIQPDRTHPEAIRRFERERQIVASLHHPHIAQLYDGGVTEDGRPYFAMEFVEGEPIDRYCDRQRMTLRERLQLFLVVVRTIRYAHRNSLIHRDLKPANILVNAEGHVKLLDFGIAKLLDEDVQSSRSASFWMTPEYASPEQLKGRPTTTASDQYQLGLLLYELLTGRRPFDHVPSNLVDKVTAICSEDPPAPSEVVLRPAKSSSGKTPETCAEARRTTVRALRKRLRGDLDAIVLKALSKRPEDRYASTEQLIDEIERHLAGLPVAARADSVVYRTTRFVRRHLLAVAAAAAFAMLLVGYAATVTVQSRQIARQRDLAEATAAKAEEVRAFLIELFEQADPHTEPHLSRPGGAREVSARQLLDRGARRIEAELGDAPELRAELSHLFGKTYGRLGEFDEALRLLHAALEIRHGLSGDESLEVAQTLNDLATVYRDRGDYETAEHLNRDALGIRRRLLGEEHPKVTGSLHNLARVLEIRGKYQEAEALFRQALATDRRIFGGDSHRDVSYDLHSLGELLVLRGQHQEAESLFQRALSVRRGLYGDLHPSVASTLRQLAILARERGEVDVAERHLAACLDIHRRVLGAEHREVASDLEVLGRVYLSRGDHDRAGQTLREALRLYRGFVGDEHRLVALATARLAEVELARGQPELAEDLSREALGKLRRRLPASHPEIADVELVLGRALVALGRVDEARAHLRLALDIRRRVYDLGDPRIAEVEAALHAL